jgi:hypothetical protein
MLEQLRAIRETVSPEVLMVTGGTGAQAQKDAIGACGIRVLSDLPEYRILLRSLHPTPLGL